MKKITFGLFVFTLLMSMQSKAQLYSTATGNISFFSKTPVENIDAHSKKTLAVMNADKREMAISMQNASFEFQNKLMEEHFNEKYMESEKYPTSTFKGKVNENVDLSKEGEYPVSVTGKLSMHGVEKERTINGTIIVKDGTIQLKSEFKVALKDHQIEVPKLVMAKIAEEINVQVDINLLPKK